MSRALFSIGRRKSYFGAAVSRCLMTSMKREPVGPGEESVWDYPRPPRIESTRDRLGTCLGVVFYFQSGLSGRKCLL